MIRRKIFSWKNLKEKLASARKKRKKIVFTNGCFDLLHAGHVKVLTACKSHGDILVLGLNSDSSVRHLKGPGRPLVSQKDRAALLAGLEPVDYVVIFNEATPDRLIQFLKPDVLVKGGDYKSNEIVGRQWVKKVVRVPLVKGLSTTELIKRIVSRYGK